MATTLSKEGASLILSWITGGTPPQPLSLEIRLMSVNGTMDTPGTELTGSTYVRKTITFASAVDVGSGLIRSSSDTAINWTSLDASSSKTINGIEIWDSIRGTRLAFYGYASGVVVAAGAPFNNAVGEFTVEWLITGTDGTVGFDKAMRQKMIDWLLGKTKTQPQLPLRVVLTNSDGTFQTPATALVGDLWEEQPVAFDTPVYASSKVSTQNSSTLIFAGIDSVSSAAIPAFEIWDSAGPDVRIAYIPPANHPVASPPSVPAGKGIQIPPGYLKLKVV